MPIYVRAPEATSLCPRCGGVQEIAVHGPCTCVNGNKSVSRRADKVAAQDAGHAAFTVWAAANGIDDDCPGYWLIYSAFTDGHRIGAALN